MQHKLFNPGFSGKSQSKGPMMLSYCLFLSPLVGHMSDNPLVPLESIERTIHIIRGHRVMLDEDLARLYGVTTGNLNKAVKRKIERFPGNFMFQLTDREWNSLIFQIGISKEGKGGRRFNPYVFTEQGFMRIKNESPHYC